MNEVPYSGDDLRERREALGLSLQDVFEELRIPTAYVDALERGDVARLPAPGYVVGFLRTYCRYLRLSPERYVDGFRACARPRQRSSGLLGVSRRFGSSWREDLWTWAAITAVLLLGWVTYAAVVRPKAEITDKRVEAGTRELVVPPSSAESEF